MVIDEKHMLLQGADLKIIPLDTVFTHLHNNNFRPLTLKLIL